MRYLASIALTLCLLVGCSRPVPDPATVLLSVDRDPTSDDSRHETTVKFHPPSKAEIVVETGSQRSVVAFDAKNPKGELESHVTLVAKRLEDSKDGKSRVETLIRPQTPNGAFAGGPSIDHFDTEKSLAEVLDVTIVDGEFPLNEPIELGALNGEPVTLTVRKLNN